MNAPAVSRRIRKEFIRTEHALASCLYLYPMFGSWPWIGRRESLAGFGNDMWASRRVAPKRVTIAVSIVSPVSHKHKISPIPRNPYHPNHLNPHRPPPQPEIRPPQPYHGIKGWPSPPVAGVAKTGHFWPAFSLVGRLTLLLSVSAFSEAGQKWPASPH